jgi:predicted 3-demethylubiquinone-9 3-methyltransferase (glyoxalase superfamily)
VKDRFGVSWQIVPTVLGEMMKDPDQYRAKRATEAMLGMKKLDIAELERAYSGKQGNP